MVSGSGFHSDPVISGGQDPDPVNPLPNPQLPEPNILGLRPYEQKPRIVSIHYVLENMRSF